MNKWLDWLLIAVTAMLVLLAEWRVLSANEFEPFPLAAGIALLLLVRVIHQHAPRFIAAKYKGRK